MSEKTYVLFIREFNVIGGFSDVLVVKSHYDGEFVKMKFKEILDNPEVEDLADAIDVAEADGLFELVEIDDTITVVI